MKKLLLTIALLLTAFSLVIGNTPTASLPDSLVLALHRASKNDLHRVKTIEKAIDFYFDHKEYEKAKPYVDEVHTLADALGDTYSKGLSCYYTIAYLIDEDVAAAIPYIYEARKCIDALDDSTDSKSLKIKLYNIQAIVFLNCQMLSQEYECLSKAIEINKELKSERLNYILYNNLILLNSNMGNYRECVRIGKEIFSSVEYDRDMTNHYINMAESYIQLREFDSAMRYVDTAEMRKLTDRFDWKIKMTQGGINMQTKHYEEALDCFLEALDFVQNRDDVSPTDSSFVMIIANHDMAVIQWEIGNYDTALMLIDKALDAAQSFSSLYYESVCMTTKTYILKDKGNYEEAFNNLMATDILKDSLTKTRDLENMEKFKLQQQMNEFEAQLKYDSYVNRTRFRIAAVILVFVTMMFILTVVIFVLSIKKRKIQQQKTDAELEARNQEMADNVIIMMKKNEVYTDVLEKLNQIKESTDNRDVKTALAKVSKKLAKTTQDDFYDEFDLRFKRVHAKFYENLMKSYPNLTPGEVRLCAFLKLNMSTKDIAAVTGQIPQTILTARYRLRKKLKLSQSDDSISLTEFIGRI